jgi:DNA-binding PadR family transcriptional regulator
LARDSSAPSRIELLILSALARVPMHGYDLKLELRYKHVRWWAKAEHGHLYAALKRLEDRGFIRRERDEAATRERKVYALTPSGRARARTALTELGSAEDSTYFDVDLFVSGAFMLPPNERIEILERRISRLGVQLAAARNLRKQMTGAVPQAGRLIMDHRVDHLARELRFTRRARRLLASATGPYLRDEKISDFVRRTRVPLE